MKSSKLCKLGLWNLHVHVYQDLHYICHVIRILHEQIKFLTSVQCVGFLPFIGRDEGNCLYQGMYFCYLWSIDCSNWLENWWWCIGIICAHVSCLVFFSLLSMDERYMHKFGTVDRGNIETGFYIWGLSPNSYIFIWLDIQLLN